MRSHCLQRLCYIRNQGNRNNGHFEAGTIFLQIPTYIMKLNDNRRRAKKDLYINLKDHQVRIQVSRPNQCCERSTFRPIV